MKNTQQAMQEVLIDLDRMYAEQKRMQTSTADLAFQQSVITLRKNYEKWSTEYAGTQDHIRRVLNIFHGEFVDPRTGLAAAEELTVVSTRATEETALKQQIAQDMAAVRRALSHLSTSDLALSLPQLINAVPDERDQSLSLEFIAKLANKFSANGYDCEAAIDLVARLQSENLLTKPVQYQLLYQNNVEPLLSLQKFLNESSITVSSAQLLELWHALHGTSNFDLLKPLQVRLKFNADIVLTMIETLSSSWARSLSMLVVMFDDKKTDATETFSRLIHASKTNALLINEVFRVYEAIKSNKSTMLNDFFNPQLMQKLINAILNCEERFSDELVTRLEASGEARFKDNENWNYLLDRTIQYDQRNLSYVNVLCRWKENSGGNAFFDDYSQIVIGRFGAPEFNGAHQSNTQQAMKVANADEPPALRASDSETKTC